MIARGAVLAMLAGCAGAPAAPATSSGSAAITSGVPDTADDGVVAILVNGGAFCSGTLVAPRVVVTAAHCVAPARPSGIGLGPDPAAPVRVVDILDVRAHPAHDAASGAHDIAAILLAAPVSGIRTWPLNTVPLDASWTGAVLRLVGYGRDVAAPGEPAIRREGTTVIDAVTGSDLVFHASPSQTCTGDSGGPAFLMVEGIEVLAGVASGGDTECRAMARDVRVDVEVAGFLAPYLAATADGAAATGQRCFFAENCAGHRCEFPRDAPHRGYCTAACGGDAGCPPAMACVAGACAYPAPSPGAPGGACDGDADCGGEACVGLDGRAPVCAARCFPGNQRACADGLSCRPSSARPGQAFCGTEPGGCAATGGDGGGGGLAVAVALALAALATRPRWVSRVSPDPARSRSGDS